MQKFIYIYIHIYLPKRYGKWDVHINLKIFVQGKGEKLKTLKLTKWQHVVKKTKLLGT